MFLDHFFDEIDPAKVTETKEAWLVEMDMPGVPKDKVDITVAGRELTLSGERSQRRKYRRTFELPAHVKGSSIEASLDLGVLTLKIPKARDDLLRIPIA